MISSRSLVMVALSALTLSASPAAAGGVDDFGAALQDSTGNYYRTYVLTKLTTFNVGKKCLAKLSDKNQGAVHLAGFYTQDIAAYAKAITGDDWSAIESQHGSDRETTKKLVEPMVDAFKAKFTVTINVDGDDCDAKSTSLWLRYWGALGTAVKAYPPPGGKAFITLNVSSKTRDVTVEVKEGSTFVIHAPKDIEAKDAPDKLERPFRKLASGFTDDFAFASKESSGRYSSAWVLTKFVTFKLGKKCLAKLSDKTEGAIHAAGFFERNILAYAKSVGADDWEEIEGQRANDPETNRTIVEKMMNDFKSRLSIVVTVEGDDCDAKGNSRWIAAWSKVGTLLKDYPPKANKVVVKLDVKAKAKAFAITTAKDGSTISITAPLTTEPSGWTGKLEVAFKKVSRKK